MTRNEIAGDTHVQQISVFSYFWQRTIHSRVEQNNIVVLNNTTALVPCVQRQVE